MGKRALSPRATRRESPALGEPIIQDLQPTAIYQERRVAPYFSVPSGGPGSEQRIYQDDWPAPAPDQSPECDDLSTVTGSQTPLGDEAPEGYVQSPERARSDTEPTSEGKDQPQDEGQEDEPSPAKLANQLNDVASSLEAMANAVPPDAKVDIQDLLPVHSSPTGMLLPWKQSWNQHCKYRQGRIQYSYQVPRRSVC